jgi:hypothetical protein
VLSGAVTWGGERRPSHVLSDSGHRAAQAASEGAAKPDATGAETTPVASTEAEPEVAA